MMKTTDEYIQRAQAFYKDGKIDCAVECLQDAIKNQQKNSTIYNNLGLLFFIKNDIHKAIQQYNQALKLNPDSPESLCNLGNALKSINKLDEAKLQFQKALQIKNNLPDALLGLGNIEHALGNLENAKRNYCALLQLQPTHYLAFFYLGSILREWNKLSDAKFCFQNAIRFNPVHTLSYINLGEVLQLEGLIVEAEKILKKALELEPENPIAWSNFLLTINYNINRTPENIVSYHKQFGDVFTKGNNFELLKNNITELSYPIRIGYISSDFCNHPAARFMDSLLKNHNRELFEIYCYSNTQVHDKQTEKFKSYAFRWHEISTLSDNQVKEIILNDSLHVLFECTGHMANNRLTILNEKLAPVQISWCGYPNTTGLKTIDYFLTDEIVDPISENNLYTETPIRLDSGFCTYTPPENSPPILTLPALKNNFITFGSLHTLSRLNEGVIGLWSEILNSVPESMLLICRSNLNNSIIERLSDNFQKNGIDPKRIIFQSEIPSKGHLSIYNQIDLSLDTFPWSGHTTTCESLWMGVPVISLYGDRHAGRMVSSVLKNVGLESLIAYTKEEYVMKAIELSSNKNYLVELRKELRDKMRLSRLCDGITFTQEVENKLIKILQNRFTK